MDPFETVSAWALATLEGKPRVEKKTDKRPRGALQPVLERFALDAIDRKLIELSWAVARSFTVARAAGGPLTVERLRHALGDAGVDARLEPGAPLRRHGLLVVDDGWLGGATARVELAPGLARRLAGEPVPVELLGPATRRLAPVALERAVARPLLAELVSAHLRGGPRLVSVEGCGRRDALALAAHAAESLGRSVLVLDGEALAPLPGAWWLLAAARREADLEGDVLLVVQSAALGESWRAAAAPAPASSRASTLVVLADVRPREIVLDEGLPHQMVALVETKPGAGAPARPKDDDGFDHVRQQAVRDAERALGIVKREPPRPIPPPARPVAPAPTPQVAPARTASPPPSPVVATMAPHDQTPQPAAPSQPAVPSGAKPRRSKKALQFFGDPEGKVPPAVPAPARPEPPASPQASAPPEGQAVAGAPPPVPVAAPGVKAPYVPIPADAPVDMVARIAASCANPDQRIDLLYKIAAHKSPTVVAALRGNLRSEHPGVRAAAEAGMAALFGPEWNRTRAIGKPVQPPRSDDNDRGPPGGL